MGVFLVLSGDYRIGASGPCKLTVNEVAIGMTMPRAAVEICRRRLTPACLRRAVVLAGVFAPGEAVAAGFLDRVVPAGELARPPPQRQPSWPASTWTRMHAATKQRVRQLAGYALGEAIDAGDAGYRAQLAAEPAG
jgi:enoyl-CoA hydratase